MKPMAQSFLEITWAPSPKGLEEKVNEIFEDLFKKGMRVANSHYKLVDETWYGFITYYNPET